MTTLLNAFVATFKATETSSASDVAGTSIVKAIKAIETANKLANVLAKHFQEAGIDPDDALKAGGDDTSVYEFVYAAEIEATWSPTLKALMFKGEDITKAESKKLADARSQLSTRMGNLRVSVSGKIRKIERAKAEQARKEAIQKVAETKGEDAAKALVEKQNRVKAAETQMKSYVAMIKHVDAAITYWQGENMFEGTSPAKAKAALIEFKAAFCTVKLAEK